ncbi:MAG TPA: hypothetical protein VMU67_13740 [Steroidobacteraceae bacterium]|nr:hypothetical protein [Steroidobacteraceae bacterium]
MHRTINRRELIEAAAALASACAAPLALASSLAPHAGLPHAPRANASARANAPVGILHAVVFDQRSRAAQAFARSAAGAGLSTRPIGGDVTDLWYAELHPMWKRSAAPLAGLTAYGALFCLERLAWDHRLRVVQLGTHRLARGRPLAHTLQGPLRTLGRPASSGAGGWAASLAEAFARVDRGSGWRGLPPVCGYAEIEHRLHVGPRASADETLYSWVIA